MKNQLCVLAALGAALCLASCSQKPVVGDNDPVKATYIHKYGIEVDGADDWKERGASGQVVKTLKNGANVTETWKNGQKHGPATITYPYSETIYQKLQYDNGTCIKQTTNYATGLPKREEIYDSPELSQASTWYEDGLPQSLEQYQNSRLLTGAYFTPSQELEAEIVQGQGERPMRDGYGQLKGKELFADGLLVMKVELHTTGMPRSYTPYACGRIQGTRNTYSPTGEPETIEEWGNDRLNGLTIVFQNGEKVAEVPYIDGERQGVEKRLRAGTDEVVQTISWLQDVRHGPSIVYVDGDKITDWYFAGNKVSRAEFVEKRQ